MKNWAYVFILFLVWGGGAFFVLGSVLRLIGLPEAPLYVRGISSLVFGVYVVGGLTVIGTTIRRAKQGKTPVPTTRVDDECERGV